MREQREGCIQKIAEKGEDHCEITLTLSPFLPKEREYGLQRISQQRKKAQKQKLQK